MKAPGSENHSIPPDDSHNGPFEVVLSRIYAAHLIPFIRWQ